MQTKRNVIADYIVDGNSEINLMLLVVKPKMQVLYSDLINGKQLSLAVFNTQGISFCRIGQDTISQQKLTK